VTCRDDVGDHVKWAQHFGATRIIHEDEVTQRQGTDKAEVKLTGSGPWQLPDGSDDVTMVFTPGHTRGHCCLHYAPDKVLCTGEVSESTRCLRRCKSVNKCLFIFCTV